MSARPAAPKGARAAAPQGGGFLTSARPAAAKGARVAAGLGCDRGTPVATVRAALAQALQAAGLVLGDVAVLASIEAKSDEVAFLELAAAGGWPLRFYAAAALAAVPVPNPSATVLKHMGTPSVSEAAALLAASAPALLVEKFRWRGADGRHATVSLALMRQPALSTPCEESLP